MSKRLYAVAVLVVIYAAVLLAAAAAPASVSPITKVWVTPSPFYDDVRVMHIHVRVTSAAPKGMLYFARWQADSSQDLGGCSVISTVDPKGKLGGPNAEIVFNTTTEADFGGASFCPGPSVIDVVLRRANAAGRNAGGGSKVDFTYRFRVYRAP